MTTTSRGVVAAGSGARVRVEEILVPDPGPRDALVRVLACGVCHSDLSVARRPMPPERPMLLGHEAAVVVEAVGSEVSGLGPGDHGILAWRAPCGSCRTCRRGEPRYCEASLTAAEPMRLGDGRQLATMLGLGAFAERLTVAAAQVIPVDASTPAPAAALIGCGVMTGFGAATKTAPVGPGDQVAVFGCGGVGDAAIAGARHAGATTVIGVDTNPAKLPAARHFGATHVVDARAADAVAEVRRLTGGAGADVVIEAVGSAEAYRQAFYARSRTGTLVQVGVPGAGATVTFPLQDLFQRGPIKTSWYGDCLPAEDFPVLVDLYRAGDLDLEGFVTETIALDEVAEAFERLERGEVLRSVVVL